MFSFFKTNDLENLIKKSKKIIASNKKFDGEFWEKIDNQVNQIKTCTEGDRIPTESQKSQINFGRLLANQYSTQEDSVKFKSLFKLYETFQALGIKVNENEFKALSV